MARNQQAGNGGGRSSGTPGAFSRWVQQKMNARMNSRVRRNRGTFMGMDVLILHTVGRRSGQRRESPVAWFADGEGAWVIVASGGGGRNPDWHLNMMANPDQVSIELPGREAMPVTPRELQGGEREQVWQRIIAAQPRYAKYQGKTDRQFPVVRLTAK